MLENNNKFLLFRYSFMAFPLAFLGIPLYIYLPKFYHDNYGVSLTFIGSILFLSRLFDALTDPIFGVLSDKFNLTQTKYFVFFSIGLVFFFNAFFFLGKDYSKNFLSWWFAICTIFVYIFFSLVYINYYNLGLYIANQEIEKVKLSSFRELSAFIGMICASIIPLLLMQYFHHNTKAFIIYGFLFSCLIVISLILLPKISPKKSSYDNQNFYRATIQNLYYILNNTSMRWLILIFFINAIPLSITSNLLSFYADEALNAKDSIPLFLICYLLSAALGCFICWLFFKSANKINTLLLMMIISTISFSITCFLDPTSKNIFYFVCVISGIGLGGELVILPAIAADLLDDNKAYGNSFFALWTSCTKITLAMGAGIFLPLISISDDFLTTITLGNKIKFYYSIIPLLIKCISIILVIFVRSKNLRGLR